MFFSILFALAMAPINYFTRHALYLDLSCFHLPVSNSSFLFFFFFFLKMRQKRVAGSGNNARFMRASVSFFCMTVCMDVCVCVCVSACSQMIVCVSFSMSVESGRVGDEGSDRVSSSRVTMKNRPIHS